MRPWTARSTSDSTTIPRRLCDSRMPVLRFRVEALLDNTDIVAFGSEGVSTLSGAEVGEQIIPGMGTGWHGPCDLYDWWFVPAVSGEGLRIFAEVEP